MTRNEGLPPDFDNARVGDFHGEQLVRAIGTNLLSPFANFFLHFLRERVKIRKRLNSPFPLENGGTQVFAKI